MYIALAIYLTVGAVAFAGFVRGMAICKVGEEE